MTSVTNRKQMCRRPYKRVSQEPASLKAEPEVHMQILPAQAAAYRRGMSYFSVLYMGYLKDIGLLTKRLDLSFFLESSFFLMSSLGLSMGRSQKIPCEIFEVFPSDVVGVPMSPVDLKKRPLSHITIDLTSCCVVKSL